MMNYTDMHCDTALAIYNNNSRLKKNSLHIDIEKAKNFRRYSQIFAIWSENDKEDDVNYENFFKTRDYFLENLCENNIVLCKTGEQYRESIEKNLNSAILAVEGGKLISDDLSRLDALYKNDVRIFTLVWNGMCAIGGAFNTSEGLTDFGKKAVAKLNELDMIIDVSHSSEKMIYETLEITTKPIIASHSNSKSMWNHNRNLTDEQFQQIKKLGGIVGISLCRPHVADDSDGNAVGIKDIIRHIDYYLALGGEDVVCFGCDFDGAPLVDGIGGLGDMAKFIGEFEKIGYNEALIRKIMYGNADNFIINNLK